MNVYTDYIYSFGLKSIISFSNCDPNLLCFWFKIIKGLSYCFTKQNLFLAWHLWPIRHWRIRRCVTVYVPPIIRQEKPRMCHRPLNKFNLKLDMSYITDFSLYRFRGHWCINSFFTDPTAALIQQKKMKATKSNPGLLSHISFYELWLFWILWVLFCGYNKPINKCTASQ